MRNKEEIVEGSPKIIKIAVKLPVSNQTEAEIVKYMWETYNTDISYCERCSLQEDCDHYKRTGNTELCDEYMNLYYAQDLRSFMGCVVDDTIDNPLSLHIYPNIMGKVGKESGKNSLKIVKSFQRSYKTEAGSSIV